MCPQKVLFLAVLRGMWEFQLQGWNPCPPAVEVQSPNHWATREPLPSISCKQELGVGGVVWHPCFPAALLQML